jgi:hypothetical protein
MLSLGLVPKRIGGFLCLEKFAIAAAVRAAAAALPAAATAAEQRAFLHGGMVRSSSHLLIPLFFCLHPSVVVSLPSSTRLDQKTSLGLGYGMKSGSPGSDL